MKDQGPEWKYVVVIEEKVKGNPKVQCCFCDREFVGGASRIREHLTGEQNAIIKPCTNVPIEVVEEMKGLLKEKLEAQNRKRKQDVLDKVSSTESKTSKSTSKQQSLPSMFANKDAVDASVARAFYSAGIPFNVLNNSDFRQALSDVAKFGPGYTPPSEFCVRTSLLQREVAKMKTHINSTVTNDLHVSGATIVSDGWNDVTNRPIINYILVCPKGEVFLDSTDTSGQEKTSQFIADEIERQLHLVGPENVVQVITDSASNCKGSWPLLTAKFPHLVCGPCTAHCLDLLLEDLAKLDWIKTNFKEGRDVVNFISLHHKSLAIFRSHSDLQLLKPNDTRFCTEFISHSRLLQVKDSLQETVVDKNFKSWLKNKKYRQHGSEISNRLLNEDWWKTVEKIVQLCEPVVSLLRLADAGGEKPVIGKVYFKMFAMVQHVENMAQLSDEDRQAITAFVNDRWKMLHTDMHSAGFVLDPEYNFAAYSQSGNDEVMTGFCNILEKFYPGNVEKQTVALQQLTQFRNSTGLFARDMVKAAAKSMAAHTWWLTFGGGIPELQAVAVKVLSQVRSVIFILNNYAL
jgi:hypothetical protein